MPRVAPRHLVFAVVIALHLSSLSGITAQQPGPLPPSAPVTADHEMVVTIQHDASDAGLEILRAGGNAVDAAVAVGFALAVTLPAAGNLGGGGFMLIRPDSPRPLGHTADGGRPHFLDFREKAPAAASRDMYLDAQGNVIPKMSTVGARASGVPGTVAGLVYAEQHFGKLTLARVLQPAIRLASEGFILTSEEADGLHSDRLTVSPASHRIFQRDGDFYTAGDRFRQPELARTLDHIASNPDDFYHGVMAQQIDSFERANGGLITAADLAAYEVKDREPLVGHYRGLDVITSPPPSSGGIALIETLNILSGYNLHALGADRSPAQIHLITEGLPPRLHGPCRLPRRPRLQHHSHRADGRTARTRMPGAPPSTPTGPRPPKTSSAPPASCRRRPPPRPRRPSPTRPRIFPSSIATATPSP